MMGMGYNGQIIGLSEGFSNESDETTSLLPAQANSQKIKPIKIKPLVSVHSIQLCSYHTRQGSLPVYDFYYKLDHTST
jgi:hypothetical protein